jgi:prepilin-type N-terminal cleavage/methylation domain-containing protein
MAPDRHPPRAHGFTLVEMAIVLLILTLLAGSLTAGLSAHLARRAEAATDAALDEARDALLGHVVRKGYFPAPPKAPPTAPKTGKPAQMPQERRPAAVGDPRHPGLDGWSRRLRYAVGREYVWDIRHTVVGEKANLADGDIDIKTRNIDGTELFLTTDGGRTPVVILSHGANGLGATDQEGNALAPPTGSDEARNAGPDSRLFYARPTSENPGAPGAPSTTGSAGCRPTSSPTA